jgi:hypothetical protein
MQGNPGVGYKYLWGGNEGTIEIHGKEKLAWTHLNEHIFANSVPVNEFEITQA